MFDHPQVELAEPPAKRVQRLAADVRYFLLGKASRLLLGGDTSLSFDELRTFCCFVGHGRSGGTLVGALLNAHPNVVMSNELNALRRLSTGLTAKQLFRLVYLVSHRQVERGSMGGGGYSYAVKGQWQGKHKDLLIIGDRKAGATSYEILRNPRLLDTLARKIVLDKKFIHVVRNPYDTIATTFQKTLPKRGEDERAHWHREVCNYFARCTAVRLVEKRFGADSLHFLHHEQLIADPHGQLIRLCSFLNIATTEDYVRDCAGILKESPHKSRRSINWSDERIEAVSKGIKDCHWLSGYTPTS